MSEKPLTTRFINFFNSLLLFQLLSERNRLLTLDCLGIGLSVRGCVRMRTFGVGKMFDNFMAEDEYKLFGTAYNYLLWKTPE